MSFTLHTVKLCTMKGFRYYLTIPLSAILFSCSVNPGPEPELDRPQALSGTDPESVARIMAMLPLEQENLREVYDAVSSSSESGFDEEYLLSDLFMNPGSGVGGATRTSGTYSLPIRELFLRYLEENVPTRAGDCVVMSPEEYVAELMESGLQLYFPYHDEVDGGTLPVITFDPGFEAETNYGYEMRIAPDGTRSVEKVVVDEVMARERPVWVVNTNDDSSLTPFELFLEKTHTPAKASVKPSAAKRKLVLKTFRMIRNYDSWFAGASEFKLQIGSVDGFKATTDAELALYRPAVTDLVIVVKRKFVDKDIALDGLLMTDFTSQQDKIAFLLTEDDGGTNTSWKCSASVKYQSKSYGFDIDLPYRDKDDIVWRGQLSADFFREEDVVSARFGDTRLSFALE